MSGGERCEEDDAVESRSPRTDVVGAVGGESWDPAAVIRRGPPELTKFTFLSTCVHNIQFRTPEKRLSRRNYHGNTSHSRLRRSTSGSRVKNGGWEGTG